jgi:anaerobic magnesium-protoporphyrin IX monomethyl ester cyclase
MIDCLIIGQHDPDFEHHIKTLRFTFGKGSGAYQDQDLTFIHHEGKPYRAMDLLNLINADQLAKPLSNLDFLWPTIAVLGSFLHKHGMTFDYINQFKYEQDELKQKLEANEYLLVAISTTLYVTDGPIKEIVKFVRSFNSRALIIVGGPYIKNRTVDNDNKSLEREFVSIGGDIYVRSAEGQAALVNVIRALKEGRPLETVDNIVFRRALSERHAAAEARGRRSLALVDVAQPRTASVETEFVFNETSVEDNSLEENPINLELFGGGSVNGYFSLSTAKSCPYACLFCGFPSRAGEYRYLDVAAVEQRLNGLHERGVHTLTFLDDTFNVPKARFKDMLRMMIRNRYGFAWNSFYRSDQGDEETIALMAESGCEGVFLGIESASDKMLKLMNKTSRKKHYSAAIPLLRKHGIYTHANFIVGFPGETAETVQETLDFVREHKPDTYKSQLWYADNTSPIWKKKDEFNIQGIGFNWSHDTMDSNEAVQWIDRIVEEITDSAFLPQESFGMWSIFYLQRQGMSREQVLAFLRTFGSAVVVKRKGGQGDVPPHLAEQLLALGRITPRTGDRQPGYAQTG